MEGTDHMLKPPIGQLITFSTAGGEVSTAGIDQIKLLLAMNDFDSPPVDWDWHWLISEKGYYVGTLPKRLAKFYATQKQMKLPPNLMTLIGNIGQSNTEKGNTYHFDFTNDLFSWNAGDFGEPHDSCYWGGHTAARGILEEHGALAVRFYNAATRRAGKGRAWLAPYHNRSGSAWIVFNAYGPSSALSIAHILSQYWGAYYKKIRITNERRADGTLWLNWRTPKGNGFEYSDYSDGCYGTGYLIGAYETVNPVNNYEFGYGTNTINCYGCGREYSYRYVGTGFSVWHDLRWCDKCFDERTRQCPSCHNTVRKIENNDEPCDKCKRDSRVCRRCGKPVMLSEAIRGNWSTYYHRECFNGTFAQCFYCAHLVDARIAQVVDESTVCDRCLPRQINSQNIRECDKCHTLHFSYMFSGRNTICNSCFSANALCQACGEKTESRAPLYWYRDMTLCHRHFAEHFAHISYYGVESYFYCHARCIDTDTNIDTVDSNESAEPTESE